jgi:hypothetical protein
LSVLNRAILAPFLLFSTYRDKIDKTAQYVAVPMPPDMLAGLSVVAF